MKDYQSTGGVDPNKVKSFYYNRVIACLSGGVSKDYITNSKSTGFSDWSPNNVRYIFVSSTRVEAVYYVGNRVVSVPVTEGEMQLANVAYGNAYSKCPLNALVAGRVFSNLEAIFIENPSNIPIQWFLGSFINEMNSKESQGSALDKYPMFRGVFLTNPNVIKHATDVFKTPKGVPSSEQDVVEMYNFLMNRGLLQKVIYWNRSVKTFSLRPKWYSMDAPDGKLSHTLSNLIASVTTPKSLKKPDVSDRDEKIKVKANLPEKLLGSLLSLHLEAMKLCTIVKRSESVAPEIEPYLGAIYNSSESFLRHVSGIYYTETKPYVQNVLRVGETRVNMLSRLGFCTQSIGDPNWDYRNSSKFQEGNDKVMVYLYNSLFDMENGIVTHLSKAYPNLSIDCNADNMTARLEVVFRVFEEFCNHLYKNARLSLKSEVILLQQKEPKFERISEREASTNNMTISPLLGDYIVSLFQLYANLSYFAQISESYPMGVMENLLENVALSLEDTKAGREYISYYNTEYLKSLPEKERAQYIGFRKYDSKVLVPEVFGDQKDIKLQVTLKQLSGYTDEVVLSRVSTLNGLINSALNHGLVHLFTHATKEFTPDTSSAEPYADMLHYNLVKRLGFTYGNELGSKYGQEMINLPEKASNKFVILQEKALLFAVLGVDGASFNRWAEKVFQTEKWGMHAFYSAYINERYNQGCSLYDIGIIDVMSKMKEKLTKIPAEEVEIVSKLVAGYVIACRVCLAENLICEVAKKEYSSAELSNERIFVNTWINNLINFGFPEELGKQVKWGKDLSKKRYNYHVSKADVERLVSCGFVKCNVGFELTTESLDSAKKKLINFLGQFRSSLLNRSVASPDSFLNVASYADKIKEVETKSGSETLNGLDVNWVEKISYGFSTSLIEESARSSELKVKAAQIARFLDNAAVSLKYIKFLNQLMSDKYVKGIFPEVTSKTDVSDVAEIENMASTLPDTDKFSIEDVNLAKSKMDSSRNGIGLLVSTGLVKGEGTQTDVDKASKETGEVLKSFIIKSLKGIQTALQVYDAFANGGLPNTTTLIAELRNRDLMSMTRGELANTLAYSLKELYSIFYTGTKDISTASWVERLLK